MERTYTFVIADDEPIIVRSLSVALPWAELGFELAGSASNGEEALAVVKAVKPDVLITDIRMPIMDGLQLLAETKRASPSTVVIMLSGFGEFAYAREAIRLAAFDYILKPIDHEELERTMKQVRLQLDAEAARMTEREYLHRSVQSLSELVRERLLGSMLEGTDKPYDRLYWLSQWDFEHPYRMLLVTLDDALRIRRWSANERKLWHFAVTNILSESAGEDELITLFPLRSGEWVMLVQHVEPEGAHEIAARASDHVRSYAKLSCSIGISGVFEGIEALHDCYRSARRALASRFFGGRGSVHADESSKGSAAGHDGQSRLDGILAGRLEGWENSLAEAMSVHDREAVRGMLRLIRDELQQARASRIDATASLLALTVGLSRRAADLFGDPLPDGSALIAHMSECTTLDEMTALLEEAIASLLGGMSDPFSREKDKRSIHKAVEYAEQHFARDIGIDEAAEHAGLSSSHFCVLFKKETGLTFLEYVTKRRIEMACSVLAHSDAKVHRVASMVGYQDPKYFAQVFKKLVGVTPTEYRQGAVRHASEADGSLAGLPIAAPHDTEDDTR